MGYQESYVTTFNPDNFEAFVKYIQKLGPAYFEAKFAEPVRIITIKQPVTIDIRGNSFLFHAGTQFVYVVGERQYQRRIDEMFEGCPVNIWNIFTEQFPSYEIFKGIECGDADEYGENASAKHEPFPWKEAKQ